jgi:hypothetical protein
MKKVFILSFILLSISAVASAQVRPGERFRKQRIENGCNRRQITRPERMDLKKDQFRYQMEKRRTFRDGMVTPLERRKLGKMKRHERRDLFYFKHNNRRRII